MGCHFGDEIIKRLWLPSWDILSLPLGRLATGRNQLLCHEAALWRGPHGWAGEFFQEMATALANTSVAVCEGAGPSLFSRSQTLDPQTLRNNNCFQAQGFGVGFVQQ